jgi:undecaprenyl-diphosphatase
VDSLRRSRPAAFLGWFGKHELRSIVAFCVFAGAALGFMLIASEVSVGDATSFDRKLLLALRNPHDLADPLGPPWVEEAARDFSALGGLGVLSLATLAVVGYLALLGRRRAAVFVAVAVCGSATLSAILKAAFERPRPELVPHLVYVTSSSFPSGHAMLSAAVYLSLGALIARLERSTLVRAYVLVWAVGIVVLVGVSRVYLGVHWPSDVLAGWAAGAAWASLCWGSAAWLERREKVGAARVDRASQIDEFDRRA